MQHAVAPSIVHACPPQSTDAGVEPPLLELELLEEEPLLAPLLEAALLAAEELAELPVEPIVDDPFGGAPPPP